MSTPREGTRILENFVFNICGCKKDWNPGQRIALVEDQIRQRVGDRNVFFFVSGGVDSTVAFTLCLRALGPSRVRGVYVDTGLMREGETEFVERTFRALGAGVVDIAHCEQEFLDPLESVRDPELKRHVIGEQFVRVQERIIESRGLLDDHWILGQGTIYPDTIESGGTAQRRHHQDASQPRSRDSEADGIRPHRRAAGRFLQGRSPRDRPATGLCPRNCSTAILSPAPGLAIRCLCSETEEPVTRVPEGWLIPVRSVGVQGDSRSYAPVLAIDAFPSASSKLQDEATELINRTAGVNRVIARVAVREPLEHQRVFASSITHGRLDLLRRADAIVREMCHESGFRCEGVAVPGDPDSAGNGGIARFGCAAADSLG